MKKTTGRRWNRFADAVHTQVAATHPDLARRIDWDTLKHLFFTNPNVEDAAATIIRIAQKEAN